jgi:hypothetical protein
MIFIKKKTMQLRRKQSYILKLVNYNRKKYM